MLVSVFAAVLDGPEFLAPRVGDGPQATSAPSAKAEIEITAAAFVAENLGRTMFHTPWYLTTSAVLA